MLKLTKIDLLKSSKSLIGKVVKFVFKTNFLKRKFMFQFSQTNNSSQIITQFETILSAKLTLIWRKHAEREPIL